MKFQNPSLNSVLKGRKDERTNERTSRNQYAPHFFKVGGIKSSLSCTCISRARWPSGRLSEIVIVMHVFYHILK